jgi:CRP-like cAMP-binding protein
MIANAFDDLHAEMATLIQNSHLFKSLDDEGRKKALSGGALRSYPTGQVILQEGETGDEFYLVKSGTVRVTTLQTGSEVVLANLQRGGFFGEVAVLSGQPRTASVTALEPVELVVFDKALIDRLLSEYPKVRTLLEAIILGRARNTIERLSSA